MNQLSVGVCVGSILLVASSRAQSRITLASATNSGAPPNYESLGAPISGNGRFALFSSNASNLVAGDTNNRSDLFVRDLLLGVTERVNTYSNGAESPAGSYFGSDISADGRFVAFTSDDAAFAAGAVPGVSNVFVKDRATGAVVLASRNSAGAGANAGSWWPAMSDDGSKIAFVSDATNLAPGDDGLFHDVFVHDLASGVTMRVSVDSSGIAANDDSFAPQISSNGLFVVFESPASNLVGGDTNTGSGLNLEGYDVFVHDLANGTTERASVRTGGAQAQSGSYGASISADGRLVCFASRAPDLVPGDLNDRADVFVRDRLLGTTELVSLGVGGVQTTERANNGEISADGNVVLFTTIASNLVPNDPNIERDVYVRDLARGTTALVSQLLDGTGVDSGCYNFSISSDGRFISFETRTNAFPGPNSWGKDVFVADRGPSPPLVYCTAKVNSLGCLPAIGVTGVASASEPSGCVIHAVHWREARPLQLVYGVSGPNAAPFHGGTLCVRSPLRRLALRQSSGSSSTGCAGTTSDDFNAVIAAGLDPALAAGQHAWCQYIGRDDAGLPGFAYTTSDAVELVIEP